MRVAVCLITTLAVAACGGSTPADGRYALPAGGETVIEIPSRQPRMVSFGFELGSPSWDATDQCPVPADASDFAKQHGLGTCGGLYDANAPRGEWAAYFKGMHGGGVTFQPKDGMIRVRLVNHADRPMEFLIEVAPA